MVAALRGLAAATMLLTRIPLPASWASKPTRFSGALGFPLVGALIGALVGATAALAGHVESPLVAAGLALAVDAVITGALHLDGLADSADSFGARSRERALAIMRDHTLGTYGVCALTVDLLLKAAALSSLQPEPLPPTIAAMVLARAISLPLAVALPYARESAGLGRLLSDAMDWPAALTGTALAAAVGFALVGEDAIALLPAALLTAAAVGLIARRRLGGMTGDTMGSAVELTGTVCLLLSAALAR